MDDRYKKVCRLDEVPAGGKKRVRAGKWTIALFNLDGTVYAIKDACPHQDISLLSGSVEGTVVTCPGHVWKFDLRDGHCVEGDEEMSAKTFPVQVSGGDVYVEI